MKKTIKIGKINTKQLLIHRAGKVNVAQNPEIRSSVQKSAKDYNRQRGKSELRKCTWWKAGNRIEAPAFSIFFKQNTIIKTIVNKMNLTVLTIDGIKKLAW